jgi:hypothetical protein
MFRGIHDMNANLHERLGHGLPFTAKPLRGLWSLLLLGVLSSHPRVRFATLGFVVQPLRG